MLMPRKPALLLSLLNLVLKPLSGQNSVPSPQSTAFLQRPLPADRDGWHIYWREQNQGWRTEPEIDTERQAYLASHRVIKPNIRQGIYPFKDIKLSRADVEWLLATHHAGRGPLFFEAPPEGPHMRGLDLRGADLRFADLHRLPLSGLRGGLSAAQWFDATLEQRETAAVHLEGANLCRAILQGASLRSAHLEGADLSFARLERATLRSAHLEGTEISSKSYGQGHLMEAVSLEVLPPADLHHAFFDNHTSLNGSILGNKRDGFVQVVDVQWNNMNLSQVNWELVDMSGDERKARQRTKWTGEVKDKSVRLNEYQTAVRANRQLAVAFQSQGLNEDAARFAYRAQVLQKRVLWFLMKQKGTKFSQRMRALSAWLFSWFLYLLAGYGYRLGRSFLAYLLIISLFMTLYHVLDPHLAWNEAFVVSMTAFHGRGFSPSTFTPGDPLSFASAAEAFVGLIIEVTFIATLTQRFFNR
jgi:uncharacterized protein YjbI with pentapeptide repeats